MDIDCTPKPIQIFESLVDFSTPLSSFSNRTQINTSRKIASLDDHSTETIKREPTDLNEIYQSLQAKFDQHQEHFFQTKISLQSLDKNLHELGSILHQLEKSFPNDLFQTRLLQMAIKCEQIDRSMKQSPIIHQTLHDLLQQISPTTPKLSKNQSTTTYSDLIKAMDRSFKEKSQWTERFSQKQQRFHDARTKLRQRQEFLMGLVEQLITQEKNKEKSLQTIDTHRHAHFSHSDQLIEFQKLNEEYQNLQDENRTLKQQAKDNIQMLYNSIHQTIA